MKQFSIAILMLLCTSALYAQDAKSYIHKGNELYNQQKFDEAAANYAKSVEKKGLPVEGNFNLGDALYKEKKYGDAAQHFTDITAASNSSAIKSKAFHNLGNSLLESKKYDESIDAYKKSLLNNPKDDATRYNLAYAQEMLKKQQQQNKQNKNNQNKNNQNNKDKNKSDQDKKNQDKNKNDQNKNNQDQQNKDQDKQKQQQEPNKLSKEDAQHMLDALNDQEKNTQDKLKNKKLKGSKMHIDKDW